MVNGYASYKYLEHPLRKVCSFIGLFSIYLPAGLR